MFYQNLIVYISFEVVFTIITISPFLVTAKAKWKAKTPIQHQEHLLRNLPYSEIGYPTETNRGGGYIRHVTSPDHHRRMRRSIDRTDSPIYYNITYRGTTYNVKLRLNKELLGSGFVVERHKKGGKVETTRLVDNCYLVGETAVYNFSVALSDCDGLSGTIDIGDDVLFIEPIINETAVSSNGQGKPHLMYTKSSLNKIGDVAFDMMGDIVRPDYASANSAQGSWKKFTFLAARAFITIVNRADRPVQILYMDVKEEKLFTVLQVNGEQSINTFTSHRWLARDSISDKQLLIDGKKLYAPRVNLEYDRKVIHVTIPKGLKLPNYEKPDPPDSSLKVINRSGRFVKLFYSSDSGTTQKYYRTIEPEGVERVSTFTSHRWYAKDYDTGKPLWLNSRVSFIPTKSTSYEPNVVLLSIPDGLLLPKEVIYPTVIDEPPKYIEAMATADSSVVNFHGKDKVERYVLTLMNVVSRIFQHKSLGVRIVFVVVRLKLLEEEDPDAMLITSDAQESLNKVCQWGHKQRKGWDKTSADYHDQTIFLTRRDFGPSGYAPVGSMCYRTNSCTLNDDDGFPSAFIVAHETGHTLGMEHDGDTNNCTKDVIKGSIMAPLVRSRFDRFYWSRCSRQELISHLNYMWCLDDVPMAKNRSIMNKLPGQIYGLSEQCELDFGKGYFSCLSYLPNPCLKLWCDDKSYGHYCRTRNTPPLEGTTCGVRKWCRLGQCVPMTSDGSFEVPTPKPTPRPIDGGWSSWSAYNRCSKTCGQGVKVRARACISPRPQHNGKDCEGRIVDIAFCKIKPCSGTLPSLRQTRMQQCESRGTKREWRFYDVYRASLDCDFENGTCGWLQDDSDDFDWTPTQGKTPSSKTGPYHDHTKGPKGKGTYLFIETSRPTDVGWRARLVSQLVAKHVSCLSFWYHSFGDDDHFGALELRLNTTTKEKVIWGQSGNKGNKWIHKLVTILSVMPYRVVIQGTRGDGYRADIAIDDIKFSPGACNLGILPPVEENNIAMAPCQTHCISNRTGLIIKIPVEDGSQCYENPAKLDVCVKGKCQVVGCDGIIGSEVVYDNCGICNGLNDTCTMNKGTIRMVPEDDKVVLKCPVGATNILVQEFSDSRNYLVLQNSGVSSETFINGGSNVTSPGVYEISGTKFVYSRDENMEKLLALGPIKENLFVKVKKSRPQNVSPSFVKFQYFKPKKEPEVYIWKPIGWLNCSKPCGGGAQERLYECYRNRGMKKMEEKFCFGVTKPKPRIRKCNQDKCEIRFEWIMEKWRTCSATCGVGKQMREVYCERSTYGAKNRKVSDLYCDGKKPHRIRKCMRVQCVARWVPDPWQQCSKTCGRGIRTRTVRCLDVKTNRSSWMCTEESKPPTSGHCYLIKCVNDAPVVLGNLSCTFEAGFCRWRNTRRGDNFDWTLGRGVTRSRYTGPNNDHTFYSTRGKYIFIEASAPQSRGDKARLLSPFMKISKLCLEFWYHMLGNTMGTLNVYLRTIKGEKKLWYKEGNQGPRWKQERLQITSSVYYWIVFEAVRGNGYSSDAALDDITVYSGKCPKSKYVKTECEGDISRYCRLAVQYQWCSSIAWGKTLCCESCSTSIKYRRQRRKTLKQYGR